MPAPDIEAKARRVITAYRNEKITWLQAKQLLIELRMDSLAVLLRVQPTKDDNGSEQS